jgi:hypothetical protein
LPTGYRPKFFTLHHVALGARNSDGRSALFGNRRRQLAALATRHGLPAISYIREFTMAGGLSQLGSLRGVRQELARHCRGARPDRAGEASGAL